MIAKGTYRAQAVDGEFGTSPKKGTDFVRVRFRISDGESAGQVVSWDGYFTEKTKERTLESLRYCGCSFPDNNITDLTGIESNEVEIVVEHNEYQDEKTGEDKVFPRVAWVNGGGVGKVSEDMRMTDAKKLAFRQRMLGELLKSKQANAGGGAAPSRDMDDIPF